MAKRTTSLAFWRLTASDGIDMHYEILASNASWILRKSASKDTGVFTLVNTKFFTTLEELFEHLLQEDIRHSLPSIEWSAYEATHLHTLEKARKIIQRIQTKMLTFVRDTQRENNELRKKNKLFDIL